MSQESKTPSGKEPYYVVIYNAQAGRVKHGTLAYMQTFFAQEGKPFVITELSYINWEDIRHRTRTHDIRFIAAGGDGTLRLVLEGLWKESLLDVCTVAFVALGSANVTAISLRLPWFFKWALRKAVNGRERRIDLGVIDDTYIFSIAATFGSISNVITGARRDMKKRLGGLAYLLSIDVLFQRGFLADMFDVSFERDGKTQTIRTHSMFICNHFSAGRIDPVRGIRPDDGKLHFITVHNRTPWGLIQATYDFYRCKRDSKLLHHHAFEEATLTLSGFRGRVTIDGDEYPRLGDTVSFRVLPYAVRLIT